MKPLPIRWKFALWAAALVGCVLLVFAAGTFTHLYREQLEAVDLAIEAEAKLLTELEEPLVRDLTLEQLVRFQPWLAIAVFDRQGQLTRRTGSLPEALVRDVLAEKGIVTRREPDGASWRLRVVPREGATIVLAHTMSEVNEIMHDLFFGYALSLPFVLLTAAVGGWWVSRRALAPLRTLTTAAENVQADQLDRRVPAFVADDEIRRLAEVLNAMLARLEESFQQARRFAADASHELRTPLTIMHGEIEQLLRAPELERAHEEKLLSLQEEIGRLDRITEHLLLLAKFDSGTAVMARDAVNFSQVVETACEDAEMLADVHDVTLHRTVADGVTVNGDAGHLRRLILTLLDNATRYNQPRGEVECRLEASGKQAVFRIRNTGPGIPATARASLFQRFFRVDPARGRGGHGLGLSLSREIALAHGGRLELAEEAPAGWTEFVVTLPRAAT